jgi:hypothetical protein
MNVPAPYERTTKLLKLSDDKRVAGLAVVGPNAKSHDVCYLVAIGGKRKSHTGQRCYCVRNLYATIRATMLAKISSAERDFRIIGLVEWRAADRPG